MFNTKYTRQEAFDKSIIGLRDQNEKSQVDMCSYRGPNGLKCAIGHLIPDDTYKPIFESFSLKELLCGDLEFLSYLGVQFILTLQTVHDYNDVCNWPLYAARFAKSYDLKWNHLINVTVAFGFTYYSWSK